MHPETLPGGDGGNKQWPDFYSILDSSPETDAETLRRSINTLYIKANEQSDHRELNTRFYNQVLTQKVLPQCRRILLNEPARQAYNQQWYLHRDGSAAALSYQEFIEEISKDAGTARTLLLSDDEISILPSVESGAKDSPLSSLKNPAVAAQMASSASPSPRAASSNSSQLPSLDPVEIIEGEEVIEPETSSALASGAARSTTSVVVAPAPGVPKKAFPVLPLVAGLLVLGVGGFLWNSSKPETAADPAAADPAATALLANSGQNGASIAPTAAPIEAFDHPLIRLNTLARNADFETGNLAPWVVTNKQAYVEAAPLHDAKSGNNILTFWDTVPYDASAQQSLDGLENGKYTLRAWIQRTGGQERAEMSVKGYGGPNRIITLPAQKTWTLAVIRDIDVKIGRCTIGFSAKAPAMKHVQVDCVEFFRQ